MSEGGEGLMDMENELRAEDMLVVVWFGVVGLVSGRAANLECVDDGMRDELS